FPYIAFKPLREPGKNILEVKGLTKVVDEVKVLDNYNLVLNGGDKVAFVGPDHFAKTLLFDILAGRIEPDEGTYTWGVTTSLSYFPKNNSHLFAEHMPITDWLREYSEEKDDTYIRSFLGRLLFSGDEALKDCTVLSGGEKVRCLLSRMMLEQANVLMFDEPTSHLDLEAISALNDGLIDFKGILLFNSHDHQFVATIANRIIEFTPNGVIDRMMKFEEYYSDPTIKALRNEMYADSPHTVAL
ncbi:MAG TPA: ATP-binding cassette domain-containing protein, partial [Sphaerochaeta sp.]|nr:ATP-binding cassette domain-containing protein [Sphaerochaeta sp.]